MLNAVKVNGSVQFRDVAMSLAHDGHDVFVRQHGDSSKTYRIVGGDQLNYVITVGDLFDNHYPVINMEDFATALTKAEKDQGSAPVMEVFTL